MSTVTILGAGAMGSALATPLVANGHRVRLWGTKYEDERIAKLGAGEPHPGTGVRLPQGVELLGHTELLSALNGTDATIIAVASIGVYDTVAQAAKAFGDIPIMLASKGFYRRENGELTLIPEAVRAALGQTERSIVAIGGPCKADEVAAARFTKALYAAKDVSVAARAAVLLNTENYRVQTSADEVGVEVCAPLKNAYAIAIGYADGLQQQSKKSWLNFRSALFARAISEMSYLAKIAGGNPETAFGLAGAGDLEVTISSGRNRQLGMRIGAGEVVGRVRAEMADAGITVEGVASCELGVELAAKMGAKPDRVSLLHAINKMLEGAEPFPTLCSALAN